MSKKKHQQNQSLVTDETKNNVVSDSQQKVTQPDATNPQEHGRSMVEILAVLAVLGVLSIGGVQGYRYALNKYHSNEIVNELNLLNAQLAMFMSGIHEDEAVMSLGEPYDDSETINAGGYAFAYGCGQDPESVTPCDLDETGYYMTLNGLPEDVCKSASQMTANMMNLVEQRINGHTDTKGILCQDGDNQLTFLFDANQNPILNNVETTQPSADVTTTEYYNEATTLIENTTTLYDYGTTTYDYGTTTTYNYGTTTTGTPWYTGTGTTTMWDTGTHTGTYTGTGTYTDTYNPSCSKRGVFCRGNTYVLASKAKAFCENLGYRLATKLEYWYSDYPSYTYVWIDDNGTIKYSFKWSDGELHVSTSSSTSTETPLCIEKDAVVEKPADECQTHADCAEQKSSKEYFCLVGSRAAKVCTKGTCSGDYCVGNIWALPPSDAEYFCSAFGKRLATKEEWALARTYSGTAVWVNNGGTVETWYKCCDNYSTPYKQTRTTSAAFCIVPNYTGLNDNECETTSDCKSSRNICMTYPNNKKACEYMGCSGDSQICYVYDSVMAVNAKEACQVNGKRIITKSEYENLTGSSYTGTYWVDNGGSIERWYKSGSTLKQSTTNSTTVSYTLCVATNFSVDKYNQGITTYQTTMYPQTGTGTYQTTTTRPATTTTTRPYTGTGTTLRPATTTTTRSVTTTTRNVETQDYYYPETTTVVYPETTTTITTTTRPKTTTTTTTRPVVTTTTTKNVETQDDYPDTPAYYPDTPAYYPETTIVYW